MNINDNVPFVFRQLRPKNMPKKTAEMITRLAKAYGLENIGEIDEQFLNGFTCASEIVIAQLEKEFESGNKGEWIESEQTKGNWYCSKCGGIRNDPETGIWREVHDYKPFFCPNCGADMRGDKAE